MTAVPGDLVRVSASAWSERSDPALVGVADVEQRGPGREARDLVEHDDGPGEPDRLGTGVPRMPWAPGKSTTHQIALCLLNISRPRCVKINESA